MDKADYLDALTAYSRNPSEEIPPILEQYLNGVAKNGETLFHWPLLKPLIFGKMEQVMGELRKELSSETIPERPNVENVPFDVLLGRITDALHKFNGAPFTIQRLCELLMDPRRHYRRSDKFLRGLEKNVLVVSTVDPFGRKVVSESGGKHLVNGMDTNGSPFFPRDSNLSSNLPPVPGWVTTAVSKSSAPKNTAEQKQTQDSMATTTDVSSATGSLNADQPVSEQKEETMVAMDTSEAVAEEEEEILGGDDTNSSSSSSSTDEMSSSDTSDGSDTSQTVARTSESDKSPWTLVDSEEANKTHTASADVDPVCRSSTEKSSEISPSPKIQPEPTPSSNLVHSTHTGQADRDGHLFKCSEPISSQTTSEQQNSLNDSTGFDTITCETTDKLKSVSVDSSHNWSETGHSVNLTHRTDDTTSGMDLSSASSSDHVDIKTHGADDSASSMDLASSSSDHADIKTLGADHSTSNSDSTPTSSSTDTAASNSVQSPETSSSSICSSTEVIPSSNVDALSENITPQDTTTDCDTVSGLKRLRDSTEPQTSSSAVLISVSSPTDCSTTTSSHAELSVPSDSSLHSEEPQTKRRKLSDGTSYVPISYGILNAATDASLEKESSSSDDASAELEIVMESDDTAVGSSIVTESDDTAVGLHSTSDIAGLSTVIASDDVAVGAGIAKISNDTARGSDILMVSDDTTTGSDVMMVSDDTPPGADIVTVSGDTAAETVIVTASNDVAVKSDTMAPFDDSAVKSDNVPAFDDTTPESDIMTASDDTTVISNNVTAFDDSAVRSNVVVDLVVTVTESDIVVSSEDTAVGSGIVVDSNGTEEGLSIAVGSDDTADGSGIAVGSDDTTDGSGTVVGSGDTTEGLSIAVDSGDTLTGGSGIVTNSNDSETGSGCLADSVAGSGVVADSDDAESSVAADLVIVSDETAVDLYDKTDTFSDLSSNDLITSGWNQNIQESIDSVSCREIDSESSAVATEADDCTKENVASPPSQLASSSDSQGFDVTSDILNRINTEENQLKESVKTEAEEADKQETTEDKSQEKAEDKSQETTVDKSKELDEDKSQETTEDKSVTSQSECASEPMCVE